MRACSLNQSVSRGIPSTRAQRRFSVKVKAAVNLEQLRGAKKELEAIIRSTSCNPIFVRLGWHDAGTFDKVMLIKYGTENTQYSWQHGDHMLICTILYRTPRQGLVVLAVQSGSTPRSAMVQMLVSTCADNLHTLSSYPPRLCTGFLSLLYDLLTSSLLAAINKTYLNPVRSMHVELQYPLSTPYTTVRLQASLFMCTVIPRTPLCRTLNPAVSSLLSPGLQGALDLAEPVKAKFPDVSYADLYQLASAVSIEVCMETVPEILGRSPHGSSFHACDMITRLLSWAVMQCSTTAFASPCFCYMSSLVCHQGQVTPRVSYFMPCSCHAKLLECSMLMVEMQRHCRGFCNTSQWHRKCSFLEVNRRPIVGVLRS